MRSMSVRFASLQLRPYQERAIERLREFLAAKKGHPLVVMPPGTGKSMLVAELIRITRFSNPTARIFVLTTSQELVSQNASEFMRWCPNETDVGIYSAGLGRREAHAMVLFGTIQTLFNKLDELMPPPPPDLLIIDEAHLVPRSGDSMFGRFITDCEKANENMQIVGFTATPFRKDSGQLTDDFRDDDALFSGVAFEYKFADAVKEGYLCPLVSREASSKLDTSKVSRSGSDFDEKELRVLVQELDSRPLISELVRLGANRSSWLCFCSGVEHTHDTVSQLRAAGISCEAVLGDTPQSERDAAIAAFRAGDIRALVNNTVLTTGFNVPRIDLVALLRPTLSPGLYYQMVGRGARIFEGKKNCLVLDFAGNVNRHGLLEELKVQKPAEAHSMKEAPVKACKNCGVLNAIRQTYCTSCGSSFLDLKLSAPSTGLLHAEKKKAASLFEVRKVRFKKHHKPESGKPPSLMVTYDCTDGRGNHVEFSEWVCFEHRGPDDKQVFALGKARQWWKARGGVGGPPSTVDQAMDLVPLLKRPKKISAHRKFASFFEITPLDLLAAPRGRRG